LFSGVLVRWRRPLLGGPFTKLLFLSLGFRLLFFSLLRVCSARATYVLYFSFLLAILPLFSRIPFLVCPTPSPSFSLFQVALKRRRRIFSFSGRSSILVLFDFPKLVLILSFSPRVACSISPSPLLFSSFCSLFLPQVSPIRPCPY